MTRLATVEIKRKEQHSTHYKHKSAFGGQRITFRSQSAETHRGFRMVVDVLLHGVHSDCILPQILCSDVLITNKKLKQLLYMIH